MELAAQFARRSAAREEIGFEQLTLHSDNGGPMKGPSNTLDDKLQPAQAGLSA